MQISSTPEVSWENEERIREITDRHKGISNEKREEMYQQFVRGWVEYYKLADMKVFSKKQTNGQDAE